MCDRGALVSILSFHVNFMKSCSQRKENGNFAHTTALTVGLIFVMQNQIVNTCSSLSTI